MSKDSLHENQQIHDKNVNEKEHNPGTWPDEANRHTQ